MRKLVITQNITLDGSIEMLGDWFDPQLQDDELLAVTQRQDAESDALLLGRQTFEDFRGYWPNRRDDTTGITDYLNGVAKYVVSTNMTDPEWQNTTVLTGDVIEEMAKLKERYDRDILVHGSAQLVQTLLEHDLVDELRLMVYPVVVGAGKRLFGETSVTKRLELVETQTVGDGIHILVYRPAR